MCQSMSGKNAENCAFSANGRKLTSLELDLMFIKTYFSLKSHLAFRKSVRHTGGQTETRRVGGPEEDRRVGQTSPYHNILWNAKLTETRIFRELSIEIESSLVELKSSLIELKSSLVQLESSLIQFESSLI